MKTFERQAVALIPAGINPGEPAYLEVGVRFGGFILRELNEAAETAPNSMPARRAS